MQKQATQKRKLREAFPYWQSTPRISVRTKQIPSRCHYDVVIVGAGISGALVAEALQDGKRTIAVIDRRAPVLGSSMASTAMIQHEIDVPLFKLKTLMKPRDAERVWLRSAEAVKTMVALVKSRQISCQMHSKKALYLAGNEYGSRALASEVEARQSIGLDAQFIDSSELKENFKIDRSGGIVSNISASANPAQLTAGILRHGIRQGVDVIRDMEISDFTSLTDKVALATSNGSLITAGAVVFCTGYEFLKTLSQKNHHIISTWAIASKANIQTPAWLDDYLVWEASDPYLYFRTTSDGRLIAGGEDENSDSAYLDEKKLALKSQTIARKLSSLIGCDVGKPEYRWSAAFGTTPQGTPMIGSIPGNPNVFAAMGYGGNGITFSKIAAEIIAAQLNGKDDPDADLFPFQ